MKFIYRDLILVLVCLIFSSCINSQSPDLCFPIETKLEDTLEQHYYPENNSVNHYARLRLLEKDKKKNFVFSAKKKAKTTDYTKILLAQIRYTATEWVFYASYNPDKKRNEYLENSVLGNRFLYYQKFKDKAKIHYEFYSDSDEGFKNSIIKKIYSVAGNRTIRERKNVSPLSPADLGLEADLINVPFLFWCLGERNGAFIHAKFGRLEKANYCIEKFFMDKNTQERYLKLSDKRSQDIIYLKSVDDSERKISLTNDLIREVYDSMLKVHKISGDNRLKKGIVYVLSGLHCVIFIPLQIGGFSGILGAYGLIAKFA